MQTSTGGGLFKGFKRMLTGESFFITTFLNNAKERRKVAFAAPFPGRILPVDLGQVGGSILCQKDSFLCAARGIEIEVAFTKKLGAGLFGGEGFILQRLEGNGLAFIHAGGTLLERDLESGEVLMVDTGCLAAWLRAWTTIFSLWAASRTPCWEAKASSWPGWRDRGRYICRACRSPAWRTGSLRPAGSKTCLPADRRRTENKGCIREALASQFFWIGCRQHRMILIGIVRYR